MNEKVNSRKLSTYQYFEAIQIEYLCAILRARIYTRPKDKDFWNKVAEGKRIVINNIADRNKLPSVLTDSDLESALSRRIYRENTFPLFVYKDEEHKLSQEYFDLLYYYQEGSEVRYDLGNGTEVGTVTSYKPFDKIVNVLDTNKEKIQIEVSKVARIL